MPGTQQESDRRRAQRYSVRLPVAVETQAKQRLGLIKNTSITGALVLSSSNFPIGVDVTLKLNVGANDVAVNARVLRREVLPDDGVWHCQLAMVFDPPRPDLEPMFVELEAKTIRS